MRRALALIAPILLASANAHAGRTFYGWLYGTDVLPERGAEAASWIPEENSVADEAHLNETRWWIAPLIGINDQLELAIPAEVAWSIDDSDKPRTVFDRVGAEVRYRLVTQDPVDAPPLVPLVRFGVFRNLVERQTFSPEGDFVLSYEMGDIHVLADLGMYADVARECSRLAPYDPTTMMRTCDKHHIEARPGAGFSIKAIGDVRFGGEVHAEIGLDNGGSWAAAGPNMAWSHGRFWMSAAYGIGIYHIKDAPRVQWGIAF